MMRSFVISAAAFFALGPAIWGADLAEMKRYEYGADQACLLAVERQVEDAMTDRARQKAMAADLLGVMSDPAATPAAKQHAAIMLRICGTGAEVPALSAMLGDAKVGDFARGALERIPAPAAGEALRDALGRLGGAALVGAINSTANRHDREAASALVRLTGSRDAAVAAAAEHALGRIGGPAAATCLAKRAESGKDARSARAYLDCGIAALAEKDTRAAGAIFAALADGKYPAPVRRGALTGQLLLSGDKGRLLHAWLAGNDPQARRVALHNLSGQPTAWLLDAMKGRTPAEALPLAEVLAARGERAARAVLTAAARQTEDPLLRVRGIAALAPVGDRETASLLIDALDGESPISSAAMATLSAMPAVVVDGVVLEALKAHRGTNRSKRIELAVTRRMTAAVPLLVEMAKSEADPALREDVCAALVVLGDEATLPALVAVILGVEDRRHRDRIETTYLEIAKRHGHDVAPIVAAMTDDARTIALLPAMGRVGGPVAEARVEKALASPDGELKAAGIRALCNWPDARVSDKLAELVRQHGDADVRVAALRAYVRVVSLESERPGAKTLEMLQWAFGAAERPEERNLVVDRVSAVRTMATLRWLVGLLGDKSVAQEACRSIVDLAHHRDLRNPNRREFAEALRKVIATSKDKSTVLLAKGYLEGV